MLMAVITDSPANDNNKVLFKIKTEIDNDGTKDVKIMVLLK